MQDSSTNWEVEQTNLLGAYWSRLTSGNVETREAAAAAFVGYELSISKTYVDPAVLEEYLGTPSILIPFAVMEVREATLTAQLVPVMQLPSCSTCHMVLGSRAYGDC